jgi:hypothetical protein
MTLDAGVGTDVVGVASETFCAVLSISGLTFLATFGTRSGCHVSCEQLIKSIILLYWEVTIGNSCLIVATVSVRDIEESIGTRLTLSI